MEITEKQRKSFQIFSALGLGSTLCLQILSHAFSLLPTCIVKIRYTFHFTNEENETQIKFKILSVAIESLFQHSCPRHIKDPEGQ